MSTTTARITRLFCCCVKPHHVPAQPTSVDTSRTTAFSAVTPPPLTADADHAAWSVTRCQRHRTRRRPAACACAAGTAHVEDPTTPVPVCCCEICESVRFTPPEAEASSSLYMRRSFVGCDLDSVIAGNGLREHAACRCPWTGDVVFLDEVEKAEMENMTNDFSGVDLLVGSLVLNVAAGNSFRQQRL